MIRNQAIIADVAAMLETKQIRGAPLRALAEAHDSLLELIERRIVGGEKTRCNQPPRAGRKQPGGWTRKRTETECQPLARALACRSNCRLARTQAASFWSRISFVREIGSLLIVSFALAPTQLNSRIQWIKTRRPADVPRRRFVSIGGIALNCIDFRRRALRTASWTIRTSSRRC